MPTRACIIGAGASGLASAKTLQEAGIPFDCFEMGSDIGGNWRYNNDNGRSAAYDSLHIDTSKDRMAFSDFPMSDDYPIFPHHSQIFAYFQDYVNHFHLRERITFRTQVTDVVPAEGGWAVTVRHLDSGETQTLFYTAVLICNGHHWSPRLPDFPGTFLGETTHSRSYRSPAGLENRRVLVVGIGNSGVDIACEVSAVATRTVLSTRRGAHILPRYVMGRPIDKWVTPLSSRLPERVQSAMLQAMITLDRGDQEKFGIPKPPFPISATHGTVSHDLPALVKSGRVTLKPNVKELLATAVAFADGSIEPFDAIIYATGYNIQFPFLAPDLLSVTDNDIALYRKVIHPDLPGLYFIGLVQPLGPIMPLSELQAKWIAQVLNGRCALPNKRTMQRAIAAEQAALRARYVHSPRHTIQADFFPYIRELEQEIKTGFQSTDLVSIR